MLKYYSRYALVLFSMFFFCGIVSYYSDQVEEITNLLRLNEWEVTKQRADINTMKSEIKKLITEDSLATQIIFSNKRENLNLLFELIKDDYELENYSFYIENSHKIETLKGPSFYDVISTHVTLSFTTDSRVRLYMFLDELISKIPGHVHVKSIAFNTKGTVLYVVLKLGIYTLGVKQV